MAITGLHPISAIKSLFGFSSTGTPDQISPEGLKALGSLLPMGDDPIAAYYQDKMTLATDRLQLYKEVDSMDSEDITNSCLDLYAEDATQRSLESGKSIWIESENPDVERLANDLLERVGIEKQIFAIARELAKYGDCWSGISQERKSDGTPGRILKLIAASPYTMSRVEDEMGRLQGFTVCPIEQIAKTLKSMSNSSIDTGKPTDPPWSFIHWRLLGKDRTLIYGTSFLFASRRVYRRWQMCEQALVIYRIRRTPDRFVFSIVGLSGLSPEDRANVIRQVRQQLRKKHGIDPSRSDVRQEIDPIGLNEDIIVDKDSVEVQRLAGSMQVNQTVDIEYLRRRYAGTLKIPADYIGFADAKSSLGTSPLSLQDINFARMEKRLQSAIMEGIAELVQLELAWNGIDPRAQSARFTVHMNPVSALDEQQRLELEKVRAETIDTLEHIGSALGIEGDEWRAYLLQRAQVPSHLLRKSGKETSKILKGKVTVIESSRKALIETKIQQLDEAVKKRFVSILEGAILCKHFVHVSDEGAGHIKAQDGNITIGTLFSSKIGPNTFESIAPSTDRIPSLESHTLWESALKKNEIQAAKNLMTETIARLTVRVKEEQEEERAQAARRKKIIEEGL